MCPCPDLVSGSCPLLYLARHVCPLSMTRPHQPTHSCLIAGQLLILAGQEMWSISYHSHRSISHFHKESPFAVSTACENRLKKRHFMKTNSQQSGIPDYHGHLFDACLPPEVLSKLKVKGLQTPLKQHTKSYRFVRNLIHAFIIRHLYYCYACGQSYQDELLNAFKPSSAQTASCHICFTSHCQMQFPLKKASICLNL